MDQPNYYAIIPASVRYDKNLTEGAKLLYGEITALANQQGFCFASNRYLSKIYDVSKDTITRWIGQLEKQNYIISEIVRDPETKEVIQRKIFLAETIPTCKNTEYNNTSVNTTSGNSDPPKKLHRFDSERKNLENVILDLGKLKPIKPDLQKMVLKYTPDNNLAEWILEFLEHYKQLNKGYPSPISFNSMLEKLTAMSAHYKKPAIDIVKGTIERNWKSFFVDEEFVKGGQNRPLDPSDRGLDKDKVLHHAKLRENKDEWDAYLKANTVSEEF